MRRMLLAFGIITVVAPLLVPVQPAVGAPGAVDVGVTVRSLPAVISPGAGVVYEVEVTNEGIREVSGVELTDTTSNATVKTVLPSAGGDCTPPGTTVKCTFTTMLPGAKATVLVEAVHAGGDAGPTNAASVAVTRPPFDKNAANDSSSVTTGITTTSASGLVFANGNLKYEKHLLTVPGTATRRGALSSLSSVPAHGTCGSVPCGQNVLVGFIQHDVYKAEDPDNPLQLDVSFGQVAPCLGYGADKCIPLYWAKAVGDPMKPVENCPGAGAPNVAGTGQAIPDPCVNLTYKTKKGEIHYDVRLTSRDPLFSIPRL